MQLANFLKVPVIYFDIGLRRVTTAFSRDIMRRCKVVTIDMANNLEGQIVEGLSDYHQSGNWSNTQLEKYSIAREETFSPLKTVGAMTIR